MPKSNSTPDRLEVIAKEKRALEMRRSGASFEEIAVALGYKSRSGAYKAVRRGLERWMGTAPEELRALELERTDAIIGRLWPLVNQDPPDLAAVDRLMRVLDYRARITGLYAPSEHRFDVAIDAKVEVSSVEAFEEFETVFAQLVETRALEQPHPVPEADEADESEADELAEDIEGGEQQ